MKNDRDRDILLLAIFTFLTVFLWIFFELAKTARNTTLPIQSQKAGAPFNPDLNTDVLLELEQRQDY